jgi:hypothetical protein
MKIKMAIPKQIDRLENHFASWNSWFLKHTGEPQFVIIEDENKQIITALKILLF